MKRRIVALVAVVSLVVISGCPKKKDDKPTSGDSGRTGAVAATYATPEEVFEAAKTAMKNDDYAGFVACLAPENIDKVAIELAGIAVVAAGPKSDMKAEKKKAILDTAAKHSINEAALKDAQKVNKPKVPKAEQDKVLEALAVKVTNKAAFISDLMAAFPEEDRKHIKAEFDGTSLTDLKIEGDSAAATVVSKTTKGMKEPIKFKKIDGSWRMIMNIK